MPWSPQPTISINGIDRKSITLDDVQISYGRSSVWEQARSSYARISILNTNGTDYLFEMNQVVAIKVKNVAGTDVTIFTGKITSVDNNLAGSGTIGTNAIQTITAVGPFSQMSRKIIAASNYPKEMDALRMTRIFTDAGQTIDVVDTPAIYEFAARPGNPADAYSLAATFAQQAFGYIYETSLGKVGFANESRRTNDAKANGYTVIPNGHILWGNVSSQKTLADILNNLILTYDTGTKTATDATSISDFGQVDGSIATELHNAADAQTQADRYVTLRAYPRTSLSSFTIPINSTNISDALRDFYINMSMGEPIQITALPIALKNTTYRGFVEGYSFSINQYEMIMTLNTTDYTYSFTPTRWQDVDASLTWNGVGATVQWTTYDD
jgi:hypothetical protein